MTATAKRPHPRTNGRSRSVRARRLGQDEVGEESQAQRQDPVPHGDEDRQGRDDDPCRQLDGVVLAGKGERDQEKDAERAREPPPQARQDLREDEHRRDRESR